MKTAPNPNTVLTRQPVKNAPAGTAFAPLSHNDARQYFHHPTSNKYTTQIMDAKARTLYARCA